MPKSLQEIEDYYQSKGLSGEILRQAIEKDNEYQLLLKDRKAVIKNKFGITDQEEKKYPLPSEEDYEILSKVKELESKELSETDSETVELVGSQLEDDWRKPLLDKLNLLLEKYQR